MTPDRGGGYPKFSLLEASRAVTSKDTALRTQINVAVCLCALLSVSNSLWVSRQGRLNARVLLWDGTGPPGSICGRVLVSHRLRPWAAQLQVSVRHTQLVGLRWVTVLKVREASPLDNKCDSVSVSL